jgi:hypothetical protein
MIKTRLVAGGAVVALAAAVVAGPAAQAATSSAGTSQTTTRVLEVDLGSAGSLLALKLVGEEGTATTAGAASALARLRTFDITSGTIGALNLSGPVVEATSTGTRTVTPPAVDLAAPAGVALPAGLLGGRIVPGTLTAAVDANGARSALGAAIEGLSIAGGLVSAGTLTSNLGATVAATDATGIRGLEAGAIKVVDLGALLEGLGIRLPDLPLAAVSDLLGQLGLSVPQLAGTQTLEAVVTDLTGKVSGLTALVPSLQSAALLDDVLPPDTVEDVTDALDPVDVPTSGGSSSLTDVVGTLSQSATDLLASVGLSGSSTVQDLVNKINELTGTLTGALNEALKALDAAPLLSVDGVKVGVQAKAARTVESSLSQVTATVGSIKVGSLPALPGLDLGATAGRLSSVLATVQGALDGILSSIDPGLAGIVKVTAFEKTSSVTPVADGTKAVAGLTALTATIAPPANLAQIIQTLTGGTGIGDLLAGAGLPLPSLDSAMSQLTTTLGGLNAAGFSAQALDLGALAGGAAIRLGTVSAASTYGAAAASVPGQPVPQGQLPRTGSEGMPGIAGLAALLLALGIGLPVWTQRPATRRID